MKSYILLVLLLGTLSGAIADVNNSTNSTQSIDSNYDDATYTFNGFESIESVPIIFPRDICIMDVDDGRYVAALHTTENGKLRFVVFRTALNATYEEIFQLPVPLAIDMDCKSDGTRGFIAIGYNLTQSAVQAAKGSPIFEIADGRVRAVQFFTSTNLKSVQFLSHGADIFLLQTFHNTQANPNINCPYFKWTGYSFNMIGRIPCSNAKRIEHFTLGTEIYIAIANYADKYGRTNINSEVYKYDGDGNRFVLFQTFRTSGAIDVKFFSIAEKNVARQNFLVFANSMGATEKNASTEANSVIYKYEKEFFVPYQELQLYLVQEFLPIQNGYGQFILLISCENQDMLIFELNDWKFQEASSQYTEGALGKGVSSLRRYDSDGQIYLVIANEKMIQNQTNIFLPIFKEENGARTLRQEIITWSENVLEQISNWHLDKLQLNIKNAVKNMANQTVAEGTDNLEYANVGTAYTNELIIPSANFTRSYWRAIAYAQQAIEGLEAKLNELSTNLSATIRRKSRVAIGTLVVRNNITAETINNQKNDTLQLKQISSTKVLTTSDWVRPDPVVGSPDTEPDLDLDTGVYDSINVDRLNISGTINRVSYDLILNNAMRQRGNQVVAAKVNIRRMQANSVTTRNGQVNEVNVSDLILINGDHSVVNQDIQFAEPIFANNVIVNERINNIHVVQGKLDVLLTNSNEMQTITGIKNFENVRLLEPVSLGGKLYGSHLERMIPVKPIHEDITRNGDFTITGNVIIRKQLTSGNILGESQSENLQNILSNGLQISDEISDRNFKFFQPVTAETVEIRTVNDLNVNTFVKMNTNEIQVITGHKVFQGDVSFQQGYCEATEINGVDVQQLEKRILSKFGDQTISGTLRFKSISTETVNSNEILLEDIDVETILTYSTAQDIPIEVVTLPKISTDNANIQNIFTSHKIFGIRLDQLLTKHSHPMEIFNGQSSFIGNVTVRNLNMDGMLNGRPIGDIEKRLLQLDGSIKFVGAVDFGRNMKIGNVTFTGNFNGMAAAEFGHAWLGSGVEQEFTQPQVLTSVVCEDDMHLEGSLNGYNLNDFEAKTYRVDRPEFISRAVFNNIIFHDSLTIDGTVNGMNFNNDIFFKYSKTPQILKGPLESKEDIEVTGRIKGIQTLNGVHIDSLTNYLNSNFKMITVENGIFEIAPKCGLINSLNLTALAPKVWLTHDNVVMPYHVELADAIFEQEVQFDGPINSRNIQYLRDNYFSLTRPQEILTELKFVGSATFEDSFVGDNVNLYGPITDLKSSSAISDFDHFVQETVLSGTDQIITGNWNIKEIIVEGPLNNVLINNLNLINDVVRSDIVLNNITATKYIPSATIGHLITNSRSTVNGIKMSNWIQNAVMIDSNFTIQGTTTIESLISYGNVKVPGTVNNRPFDEKSILVRNKDQVITGNLCVITKDSEMQKIYPNTIRNLNMAFLNGLNITEFFESVTEFGGNFSINGHLQFKSPVITDIFNGFLYDFNTDEFFEHLKLLTVGDSFEDNIEDLQRVANGITLNLGNPQYYLSHFEHIQTIPGHSQKSIGISMLNNNEKVEDWMVVLKNLNLELYRWNSSLEMFEYEVAPSWLSISSSVLDIQKLSHNGIEYLFQNDNYTFVFNELFKRIQTTLHDIHENISSFAWDDAACFIAYTKLHRKAPVYCFDPISGELQFNFSLIFERAEQIIFIPPTYLAASLEKNVVILELLSKSHFQTISILTPSKLSTANFNNLTYLGISSLPQPKLNQFGSIEIYTAGKNFTHFQSLPNIDAIQFEFSSIQKSNDLLLVVLTRSVEKPLVIYRYNGAVGFKEIVGTSTIGSGTAFSLIQLKDNGKHLISVNTEDGIEVIECVLETY